jgi:hypothetical protein
VFGCVDSVAAGLGLVRAPAGARARAARGGGASPQTLAAPAGTMASRELQTLRRWLYWNARVRAVQRRNRYLRTVRVVRFRLAAHQTPLRSQRSAKRSAAARKLMDSAARASRRRSRGRAAEKRAAAAAATTAAQALVAGAAPVMLAPAHAPVHTHAHAAQAVLVGHQPQPHAHAAFDAAAVNNTSFGQVKGLFARGADGDLTELDDTEEED